ncbi:MCE family protein [Mycolicibacterium septicum DSM 44393]|uniref:MCE family protein n=1 Tax=Mycolicibacterium septicum DSM 44393 TaxID=1341646 RepID=A0A7X6ML95_9MYCO|nr:MCE family protein [Mycolicibacterium septicum]NKZ10832.1 MCE family protein [Mycolicibacterium septicum DSM 44393]
MRILREGNRIRTGVIGVVLTVLVIGVGQSLSNIPMLFASPVYYAQLAHTGGINVGDKVRIAGIVVGQITSKRIESNHILLGFTLGGTAIGAESRTAVRTDTILGKKFLAIESRGDRRLRSGEVLSVGQSTSSYQIYDAFFDVTKAASDWDLDAVKRSLEVLSEVVDQSSPNLSAALTGVARFSDAVGSRDEQVKHLLAKAKKVIGILGDRSPQINQLLVDANTVLGELNARNDATMLLLHRVSDVSRQVQGVVADNPNLNKVLTQLQSLSGILAQHKSDLVRLLTTVRNFAASLSEALGSGPYFNAMIVNLLPGQFLQPFIDAAFQKRGIDPQKFWRDTGLPSFQFPDPNGARHANGAPPSAPTPMEGTPEHPGPAVAPGSPCSYTPLSDGVPNTADPQPCARLDQGPFGPVPGGFAPPLVPPLPPQPAAVPMSPGLPSAAPPGETAPVLPGTPVPLPAAPPGARTDLAPVDTPEPALSGG